MDRKIFLVILLIILTAAGLVVFLLQSKAEVSKIKIANVTGLPSIAIEEGFFKEEGLQVELLKATEGLSMENMSSAILAGKLDYAIFSDILTQPIEMSLRNAPIKIIMFTARDETYAIVARPGLEIKDLKTIAIFSQYTPQNYQLLKFIEKNNLKATIVLPKTREDFLNEKKLNNLLFSGEADAILTPIDWALPLQVQGFSILDILVDESPSYLVVRNDKLEKNPEEVQRVVSALEKTMEFIVTNPEETKKILPKLFWNSTKPRESLAMAEEYYPFFKAMYDRKNTPPDEGAELLIKIAKAGEFKTTQEVEEQTVTSEDLQKVFDFRFVE